MGIDFNHILFRGKISPQIPVDNRQAQNSAPNYKLQNDRFESNSPARYTSEIMIKKLAGTNPKIKQILASAGVPFTINMDGLNNVLSKHCTDTQQIAQGIVNNLPFSLKQKADINAIKTAAYLHDIGKVFMPEEILNKTTKLTEKETEIMHKHSELGYELLKNKNISPNALGLIKYHHQTPTGNGYPKVNDGFAYGLETQILNAADKYTALREKRSYKEALSREEALKVIKEDMEKGLISKEVYTALEKAV